MRDIVLAVWLEQSTMNATRVICYKGYCIFYMAQPPD
jgi:hypothetical protein